MEDTGQVTPSELASHLVALITEVNVSSRTWAQLYITVVGGIAVGGGAVITFWNTRAATVPPLFGLVPLFLFLLGALLAGTITSIILRAHKWQSWYAKRLNEVTSGDPKTNIYPTEGGLIDKMSAGHNGRLIKIANRWVVTAFVLTAAAMATIILL